MHRPSCLGMVRRAADSVLVVDMCPSRIACNGTFQSEETNNQFHPYKDYQEIFPQWSIPPDPTAEDSKYWMRFVARYKNELAEEFDAKPPEVPKGWADIDWESVSENLKQIYHL